MAHPISVLLRVDSACALKLFAGRDGWDGSGVYNDVAADPLHEYHP